MNLIETIRELSASEINCGMQALSDRGLEVWIGDSLNGIMMRKLFSLDEPDKAAQWLEQNAATRFPHFDP